MFNIKYNLSNIVFTAEYLISVIVLVTIEPVCLSYSTIDGLRVVLTVGLAITGEDYQTD